LPVDEVKVWETESSFASYRSHSGGDTALPPTPPSGHYLQDRSLRSAGRNESDPAGTRSLSGRK
jgi:hypothetical protein